MKTSITVAEEGNRRKGSISTAEIEQCVLDIVTWFRGNTPCLEQAEPVESSEIQQMEKTLDAELPEGLALLFQQTNQGIWFYEKSLMNVQAIMKNAQDIGDGLLPIAKDVDDNFLVVDTNSPRAALYEWDADSGKGSCVATSFNAFLELFRNNLLSGKYEFIDDTGIVESYAGGK
uniref:Knr4/Smi1-like domain-containing protein n=1 Tax=Fibrocapsa japonica TaxID=94617 RepID=A0A7S2V2L4_9STRA|mmetsp:Transcript_4133/g.6172  ORF Transcript_4133/g.6172 Transcript_4133/m.6172 type:complete len:175 (+) Transcript_4133:91-615(+)